MTVKRPHGGHPAAAAGLGQAGQPPHLRGGHGGLEQRGPGAGRGGGHPAVRLTQGQLGARPPVSNIL